MSGRIRLDRGSYRHQGLRLARWLALGGSLGIAGLASAGEKHHRPQLYQAVQGYMIPAPAAPAAAAPAAAPYAAPAQAPAFGAAATPQGPGVGSPNAATPQFGAAPPSLPQPPQQPQVGQAPPPVMTLPPPAATPNYVPMTLGAAPVVAAPAVQTIQLHVMTVPVQQVVMPVVSQPVQLGMAPVPMQVAVPAPAAAPVQLGQAPTLGTPAAGAAQPVTLLIPYQKPKLLNLLHH